MLGRTANSGRRLARRRGIRSLGSYERARLRRHFARIITVLRAAETATLSPIQRSSRARHLERLGQYRARGIFPQNDRFPGRGVPFFVDSDARACAVAHLMLSDGHVDIVAAVVAAENNARLPEMKTAALVEWIASSGLTMDELAAIQPSYCGACAYVDQCGKETCGGEQCVYQPVPDETPCTGPNACNSYACYSGSCVGDSAVDCDDGDPCTKDSCDVDQGCKHVPHPCTSTAEEGCAWTPAPRHTGDALTYLPPLLVLMLAARRARCRGRRARR